MYFGWRAWIKSSLIMHDALLPSDLADLDQGQKMRRQFFSLSFPHSAPIQSLDSMRKPQISCINPMQASMAKLCLPDQFSMLYTQLVLHSLDSLSRLRHGKLHGWYEQVFADLLQPIAHLSCLCKTLGNFHSQNYVREASLHILLVYQYCNLVFLSPYCDQQGSKAGPNQGFAEVLKVQSCNRCAIRRRI